MKTGYRCLLVACLLLLLAAPAGAETTPEWITGVHDGDTYTARGWWGKQTKLRLACADTPEMESTRWKRQPYAEQARDTATHLLLDSWAAVEVVATSYGRDVVHVSLMNGQAELAARLVEYGRAWAVVDYPYCRAKATELKALESLARREKRGLWADPNPCPPWKWRKGACK